ncbi:MAG TPA: peptidylprolyl isomerase [Bacteroidota bacterium]
MKRNSLLLACVLLSFAGCQRQTASNAALARFDNRTLTAEDIHARFDSTRGLTEAQLQQYVQRWLKDEILYREALANGLGNSKETNDRLADIRRQLVINEFLDKEIYNDRSAVSTPEDVQAYYEAHKREFVLRSDEALISYVIFSDRDAANRFRNIVLRGTPWQEALSKVLGNPQQSSKILTKGDSLYHTQASLLPAELWRVASSSTLREPSFPISTTEGYYVLIVWQYGKQGQPADIHFVDGEIRSRLAIERRSHLYDSLVENLRAKHSVEILMGTTGSDTTRLKTLE